MAFAKASLPLRFSESEQKPSEKAVLMRRRSADTAAWPVHKIHARTGRPRPGSAAPSTPMFDTGDRAA